MAKEIKADGDVWRPVLDVTSGRRLVVFLCASNGQRPYRVVPAAEGVETDADLAGLSEADLREMFDSSGSMNTPAP